MGFTTFTGKGKVSQGLRPNMAIHPHGRLSLNMAAFQSIGKPLAVVLHYDPDRDLIGVTPSDGSEPYAYPVIKPTAGNRWAIAATAYFKEIDLHPDKAVTIPATLQADGYLTCSAELARRPKRTDSASDERIEVV